MSERFLLPAQTLLDLCAGDENPAQRWARGVDSTSLRVSVVSIAQAQAEVGRVRDQQVRTRLESDLAEFLSTLEADAGPPLELDAGTARIWQALLHDTSLAGLYQVDRQVYATALREGLVVAEEPRAAHAALLRLGLGLVALDDANFPDA